MLEFQNTKSIIAKGHTPNWSEEIFVISKIKITVPWTYRISDINGEEITGCFYEKELQRTNQKEFRIENVIARKGNKLFVKWKGYDNSFNSCIDKKDILSKWVNTFLNRLEILEEILMSKLICLIMQHKQISKIFHKLILQVLR